ncbi:uncharacterized protein TRIVIDRAFT_203656 [Trichoderma virens Gv29-8]|uniref:Uncharacterized protein n=1 Tax=Hypocrea virens (strain Gv29-8 / FGSC 10586) TaxID=413071 RepID=G9N1A9_HYPVG|nr:uncharacterized protein TRIVIDRAFT_203656 [Trichoderma virens Gv29-8]EHK19540.1 hypothetical protein TRIVIDRAFT_203656 [Trichoderma virens Gv29-8]UKZ58201.1 hypothetical protein TrVGV298_012068 [Trichoderma virens]
MACPFNITVEVPIYMWHAPIIPPAKGTLELEYPFHPTTLTTHHSYHVETASSTPEVLPKEVISPPTARFILTNSRTGIANQIVAVRINASLGSLFRRLAFNTHGLHVSLGKPDVYPHPITIANHAIVLTFCMAFDHATTMQSANPAGLITPDEVNELNETQCTTTLRGLFIQCGKKR